MSKSSRWQPPYPGVSPKHLCCWPKCPKGGFAGLPLCEAHLIVAHDAKVALIDEVDAQRNRKAKPEPERAARPSQGIVYYLEVGSHVKIGWASDLANRMRSYPPNSRLLAAHPGTRADEARMHRRFATYRTHGREWYAPVPSLLHHIEQMKAEHGLPEVTFGAAPVTIPEPRPTQYVAMRSRSGASFSRT